MSNKRYHNHLGNKKSIEINIMESGLHNKGKEIIFYIEGSKLHVEYLLIQNAHNKLTNEELIELFKLADIYKNNGKYEIANEIFCILLDYSIHNPSSVIELIYETDSYEENIFDEDYCYYYDLAILIFNGKYLNIPIPLLSKEAVKRFFREGLEVIDRKEHKRIISENIESIKKINKRYKKMNLNKASWLLCNEEHILMKDLIYREYSTHHEQFNRKIPGITDKYNNESIYIWNDGYWEYWIDSKYINEDYENNPQQGNYTLISNGFNRKGWEKINSSDFCKKNI